jgi:hypothetical protein
MRPIPEDEAIELPVESSLAKIKVSKQARSRIEDLITTHITRTIGIYCDQVGILPQNYYAVLAGRRPCTLDFLNKLLLGIGYQVTAKTILVAHRIDTGETAPTVASTELETELLSNDEEDTDEYDCFL